MRGICVLALLCASCNSGSFSGASGRGDGKKDNPSPTTTPVPDASPATGTAAAPTTGEPITAVKSADEAAFEDRLNQAGAQTGDIQLSLLWNNTNDLDLHAVSPNGEHIYYGADRDSLGGYLDVDMNADGTPTSSPVENIFWAANPSLRGHFRVYVDHFFNRGTDNPSPFKVRIKVGSTVTIRDGSVTYTGVDGGMSDGFRGGLGDPLPAAAVLVYEFDY